MLQQLGEKGVIKKTEKKKPPQNLEKQRKSGVMEAMKEVFTVFNVAKKSDRIRFENMMDKLSQRSQIPFG